MHATTIAVDLAKSVFQIAITDDKWEAVGQERLTRSQFRAYVKRNRTDAADACALLEAARCADIVPVQVKSLEP